CRWVHFGTCYHGHRYLTRGFPGGDDLFHDRWFYHDLVNSSLFITTMKYIKYLALGAVFGIILVKSEVISWFRIQEMFRGQSFHMYGIIGSAIAVAMVSVALIKKYQWKSVEGETI